MKNSKKIGQRLSMRVSGWKRSFVCNSIRPLVAVFALLNILNVGAAGAFAADSNSMTSSIFTTPTEEVEFLKPSQGYLVETQSGQLVDEQNSNTAYNPASAVKVLTAYATIKKVGPDFRFKTTVSLEGNTSGSTFSGDVFICSDDPFFNLEYLKEIVAAFKEKGIYQIEASVFVNPNFSFSGLPAGQTSADAVAKLLMKGKSITVTAGKSAGKNKGKGRSRGKSQGRRPVRQSSAPLVSGVSFKISKTEVGFPIASATELKSKRSQTVLAILKDMLSRSDNQIAATFGSFLGGPQAVAATCRADFNLSEGSLSLATTSGLGVNRVTPKAMIAALRGFKKLLQSYQLDLSHALPIAGVDYGTIYRRFQKSDLNGVMVGKTGTLKETDNGASVLVGEMSTHLRGQVLFVVFQRGRNTAYLRGVQNRLLAGLLADSGGPGAKYGV